MNELRSFIGSLGRRKKGFQRLLVILLLNALLFAGVTYRLANKQERLSAELTRLSGELATQQQELELVSETTERVTRNAEVARTFWEETVQGHAPGLTEAWDELDRLASETNVVRGRTGYDSELLDVGLEQVSARMPVEGNYFDLVRFINRLERSERFFLVEEVRLSKRDDAEATINLDCSLTFYLKPAGGEAD